MAKSLRTCKKSPWQKFDSVISTKRTASKGFTSILKTSQVTSFIDQDMEDPIHKICILDIWKTQFTELKY